MSSSAKGRVLILAFEGVRFAVTLHQGQMIICVFISLRRMKKALLKSDLQKSDGSSPIDSAWNSWPFSPTMMSRYDDSFRHSRKECPVGHSSSQLGRSPWDYPVGNPSLAALNQAPV